MEHPSLRSRLLAIGALVGLVGSILAYAPPALAESKYPSWDEIEEAKEDESAKQAEIENVTNLISALTDDYLAAQADADEKLTEYNDALNAYSDGLTEYQQLSAQAESANTQAEESRKRAGALIAQMYRTNGTDMSLQLLLSGGSEAQDLLYKLSALGKITDTNYQIYQDAISDANLADSLARDAQVAADELAELEAQAKDLYDQAVAAQETAQAALEEQEENKDRLYEQLASLEDTTAELIAEREEGIKKEKEEEAARKKKAAAEAAAKKKKEEEEAAAAAAAAANNSSSSGSSSSGSSSSGSSSSGSSSGTTAPTSSGSWVTPTYGYISSGYDYRGIYTTNGFHNGSDIANKCGTPIYSVSSGTVVYAGYEPYGAMDIVISYGNGVYIEYAHMQAMYVSKGQSVSKGQYIADMGATGQSTGCHLHLTVYQGLSGWSLSYWGASSNTVNPVTFFSSRGVSLGSG